MTKGGICGGSTCTAVSLLLLSIWGAFRYQIYLSDMNTKCIPTSQINDPNYNLGGELYIDRQMNRSTFGEDLETRPKPSTKFEVETGVGQAITLYGKLLNPDTCEPIPNTRIEVFQGCLNNSHFVPMDVRDRDHVYINENDDCHGSIWSDDDGNWAFDARIPVTYMGHYPHWHFQVHPNYVSKSLEDPYGTTQKVRKLLGSIYLRMLYPSKSLWLNTCKFLFGQQCRILGFHEFRTLEGAFGPEFWLFKPIVDYPKNDAWYNNDTQRLMVEFDIVGDYIYEPAPFHAFLFQTKWPFVQYVNDLEFYYGI